MVFFMETTIGRSQMEKVQRIYGFFNGIEVESIGSKGRLCLVWNGDISVSLQSFSTRH